MEDVLNYMESIDPSTPIDAKDRATMGKIWKILDKYGETPSGVKRHLNFGSGNSEDNENAAGKKQRSNSRTRALIFILTIFILF